MKQLIILTIVILMSGIALAHDPNDLPANKQWRVSGSSDGVTTLDKRLPPRFKKILSKLTQQEITKTIEQMVKTWETIYRRNWFNSRTDKDMGL